MALRISRRQIMALLSATAAACPRTAWPQAPSEPVIGFFCSGSPYQWAAFVAAFREGLREMGYSDGRNLAIEFHWAFGEEEKQAALTQNLRTRRMDVIVTSGNLRLLELIEKGTSTTPIVAVFGADPFDENFVASSTRPGGRITGVSLVSLELEIKRLQIIREMVPRMTKVGFLAISNIPVARNQRNHFEDAARRLDLDWFIASAHTDSEIDDAFIALSQAGVAAVEVASTSFFLERRARLAALATRHKLPTMYPARAYVDADGLVSYGVDRIMTYKQLGRYTGVVLRGGKPAEMPVLQPSKFELVVNMKTAKALGLTVPQSLLTLADALVQ